MNEKEVVEKVKKMTGANEKKINRELKKLSKKYQDDDLVFAVAEKVS